MLTLSRCLAIFALFSLSAGCVTPDIGLQVRDRPPELGVTECRFVGEVHHVSAGGMLVGEDNARTTVRNEAAQLGATDVVWQRSETVYGGGQATARAYVCPHSPDEPPPHRSSFLPGG